MATFDEQLLEAVKDGLIPGAAMLARNKTGKCRTDESSWILLTESTGSLDYSKAVGKMSLQPGSDEPYSVDSVLQLASMTKLITTIAALQIVERGLLSLDEDVTSLVPSFAAQDILEGFAASGQPQTRKREKRITLRLLLTHSAGAGYTFVNSLLRRYRTTVQNKGIVDGDTVDRRFDHPLLYEPGEGWEYSSSLDRAGQVIEAVSGKSLEEYFQMNIFEPLGIKTGGFWPYRRADLINRVATMTFRDDKSGRAVDNPDGINLAGGVTECFGGQGGYMAMKDYVKILQSLLTDDEVLLKKETAAMMFQPQLTPPSKTKLLEAMTEPSWAVGDFPNTAEYDWSFGGILIDGDSHDYRKQRTLIWSGAANLFWFIDRESGVCGVWGTQVMPAGDQKIRPLIKKFEEEVYRLGVGH
ncbi:beta-lactamase family protein [Xylariales sp. AK1849]|nr:beta-lactamase family protein [Xylariales sp. AK1849]